MASAGPGCHVRERSRSHTRTGASPSTGWLPADSSATPPNRRTISLTVIAPQDLCQSRVPAADVQQFRQHLVLNGFERIDPDAPEDTDDEGGFGSAREGVMSFRVAASAGPAMPTMARGEPDANSRSGTASSAMVNVRARGEGVLTPPPATAEARSRGGGRRRRPARRGGRGCGTSAGR